MLNRMWIYYRRETDRYDSFRRKSNREKVFEKIGETLVPHRFKEPAETQRFSMYQDFFKGAFVELPHALMSCGGLWEITTSSSAIHTEATKILRQSSLREEGFSPCYGAVVCCFIGMAAFNISGKTLQSLLKLPRSLKPPYQVLGNSLDEVRAELRDVEILIIDETQHRTLYTLGKKPILELFEARGDTQLVTTATTEKHMLLDTSIFRIRTSAFNRVCYRATKVTTILGTV
ncbi:hypothetical protein QQF64_023902 [Cirrhinus molitorella]|uniref:Uncharacterized protein n=1 Tax=Cirrhinus molitorella TaxID=172907 RepID=A0ABR3NJT0_9TELE